MTPAARLFGALDWINHHVFRDRIIWPCWLLDRAWDMQATPGPAELERIAARKGRQ